MKTLLIILAVIALAGCSKRAEISTSVGADFVVDRLFTHEGCTVYRFSDGGYSRYFTNCSGSASWRESCGKNCNREMNVN
jgi:hypothetical protein